jgi:hypothetical protein
LNGSCKTLFLLNPDLIWKPVGEKIRYRFKA